jgi:PAS domain S-box-containing protein
MKPSRKRTQGVSVGSIRSDGVANGITKQQRMEEALGESQALMNAIVNSTPDMIWSVDPATFGLLNFNNSFRDYFFQQRGIRVQIGMHAKDILPTQDFIDRWNGFFQRALSEGSFVTDYVVSAGSNILQLTFNLLKRDGKVFGISVFGKDITERKRAEEGVRESSSRLQVLLGNLPGMAYRCRNTRKWPMQFVSEGCLALTGYTPEEITNHCGTEYGDLILPEDRDEVFRGVQVGVRAGRPFQLEYRITTKDGRLVHVWEQGRLVAGSDHEDQWLEGFITDITPQRRAEMELRRVNRALRTMSERNEAIVRATEESHLLDDICGILVRVGGYRMAWVGYGEHDEGKSVRPMAHAGFEAGYLQEASINWVDTERGRGPTGTAIRTGKSVVVRNTQVEASVAPWREEQLKQGYASSITLPILLNDNVLGALAIYAGEPDAFDSGEIQLLTELTDDMAYGIQGLRTRAENKRAEEALRLAQFSVEHASDAIFWMNSHGRMVYVNEAACRSLEYSREELLALSIPDIDPLFLKEDWGTFWEKIKPRGSMTFETQHRTKLGRVFPVEITANYVEFNGKEYSFAFARDITERQQAEAEHVRLVTAIEQSAEAVVITNPAGDIEYVNPAFTRITGYEREEVLGQNPSTTVL